MEPSHLYLMLGQIFKILTTGGLIFALGHKWFRQSKRYITDFPFLLGISFLFLLLGNFVDIIIWNMTIADPLNESTTLFLQIVRLRGILSPILATFWLSFLLLTIWFQDRPKTRYIILVGWGLLSTIMVIFLNDVNNGLNIIPFYIFPTLLTFTITFWIIHRQKRLPGVNSLLVALSMLFYIIAQAIHPLWGDYGPGFWGLSWLGVMVEAIGILGLGIGFILPARFMKNVGEEPRSPVAAQGF